jgi:copper resistance protein C
MRHLQFVILSFLFCVALTATVEGHAFLDHASPGVGSKVHGSPAEVRVWFTEKLEAAFSKLQVFNEAGQQVDSRNQRLDPRNAAALLLAFHHSSLEYIKSSGARSRWIHTAPRAVSNSRSSPRSDCDSRSPKLT